MYLEHPNYISRVTFTGYEIFYSKCIPHTEQNRDQKIFENANSETFFEMSLV